MIGLFKARRSQSRAEVLKALQTLLELSLPKNIGLSKEEHFFVRKILSCIPFIEDSRHFYLVYYEFEAQFEPVVNQYLHRTDMFKLSPSEARDVRNGAPEAIFHLVELIVSSHHPKHELFVNIPFPGNQEKVRLNDVVGARLSVLAETTHLWPTTMNIDSNDKKFLCDLLGNLHCLNSPRTMRERVVKKSKVELLAMQYGKAHRLRHIKNGDALELLKLGQEIAFKHNMQKIAS